MTVAQCVEDDPFEGLIAFGKDEVAQAPAYFLLDRREFFCMSSMSLPRTVSLVSSCG